MNRPILTWNISLFVMKESRKQCGGRKKKNQPFLDFRKQRAGYQFDRNHHVFDHLWSDHGIQCQLL